MDQELLSLLKSSSGELMPVRIENIDQPMIIETPEGDKPYTLKPLRDLYGKGINATTVDPTSDEYLPLFMGIEQEILDAWDEDPSLTDARVQLAMDRLASNPESEAAGDRLLLHLHFMLRFQLATGDYSRKDVQRVLRKLSQSVARHTKVGGQRGYLTFIRQHVPQ